MYKRQGQSYCNPCRLAYQREKYRESHPNATKRPYRKPSTDQKVCPMCKVFKSIDEFRSRPDAKAQAYCRPCKSAYCKAQYRKSHPDAVSYGDPSKSPKPIKRRRTAIPGKCIDCGVKVSKANTYSGRTTYCRKCTYARNAKGRRNRKIRLQTDYPLYTRAIAMVITAKTQAIKEDVPHDTLPDAYYVEMLVNNPICRTCRRPFTYGFEGGPYDLHKPILKRFNVPAGYVRGNMLVLCRRCGVRRVHPAPVKESGITVPEPTDPGPEPIDTKRCTTCRKTKTCLLYTSPSPRD